MNDYPTRNLVVAALLLCGILSPHEVTAQEKKSATERSMALNEAGVEAFEQGEFIEAAEAFHEAGNLVGDPALRKNEAIAWFKAKRCDDAVAAGNKFLLSKDAPEEDRPQVSAIVANCKVEFARDALDAGTIDLAEQLLADAEGLGPDQHVRDQISMLRIEIAERRGADAPDDSDEPPMTTSDGTTDRPAWQWGLLGGGAGLVVVGVIYHAVALNWQNQFKQMADSGGDPAEFDSLRRRVHTARFLVPTLYGIGAAAAGTGAVLLFVVDTDSPGTASAQHTLKIAISGRF